MRQSLIPARNVITRQKIKARAARDRATWTVADIHSDKLRRGVITTEDLTPAEREEVQLLWIEEYLEKTQQSFNRRA